MNFIATLKESALLVGDGAMGSRLIDRGLPVDVPGELWNVDNPDTVEAVQREYVEAGAQFLLTNTFGGNLVALAHHGLEDRVEELNAAAVEIARRAAGGAALVIGDIGSTGELIQPLGTLCEADARAAFAAQAAALVRAGVDAIIAETFESSQEARLALSAAAEAGDVPLILSMKLAPGKTGYRSMMGEGTDDLVKAAEESGCAAVGTNCGQGIASMVALVEEIAGRTDLPVLAEPNAGQPELVEGKTVYREDAATFAQHLPQLVAAGARIVGGCCGTTAQHVRVIRQCADSHSADA